MIEKASRVFHAGRVLMDSMHAPRTGRLGFVASHSIRKVREMNGARNWLREQLGRSSCFDLVTSVLQLPVWHRSLVCAQAEFRVGMLRTGARQGGWESTTLSGRSWDGRAQ